MKKDTIVVDIDGTLSDGSHRYHFVQGKHRDYPAFHAHLGGDPVNEWCAAILRAFCKEYVVVLVSARPAYTRDATIAWLEKHELGDLFHGLFLLRAGDDDSTPDQELKRAWLRSYGKERVLFVVDDRQKVVDMWREEGMTCLQCAAWADDKVKKPTEAA